MGDDMPSCIRDRIADGENPIQVWRSQRTISIEKLAKKVGISAAALIELETGCQRADDALLGNIAAALGVPVEFLQLGGGSCTDQEVTGS